MVIPHYFLVLSFRGVACPILPCWICLCWFTGLSPRVSFPGETQELCCIPSNVLGPVVCCTLIGWLSCPWSLSTRSPDRCATGCVLRSTGVSSGGHDPFSLHPPPIARVCLPSLRCSCPRASRNPGDTPHPPFHGPRGPIHPPLPPPSRPRTPLPRPSGSFHPLPPQGSFFSPARVPVLPTSISSSPSAPARAIAGDRNARKTRPKRSRERHARGCRGVPDLREAGRERMRLGRHRQRRGPVADRTRQPILGRGQRALLGKQEVVERWKGLPATRRRSQRRMGVLLRRTGGRNAPQRCPSRFTRRNDRAGWIERTSVVQLGRTWNDRDDDAPCIRIRERNGRARTARICTQPAILPCASRTGILHRGRYAPCTDPCNGTKDTHSSRGQRGSKGCSSRARNGVQTAYSCKRGQEMRALRCYQDTPMESRTGRTEDLVQCMRGQVQSGKAHPTCEFPTHRRNVQSRQIYSGRRGFQTCQCLQASQSVDERKSHCRKKRRHIGRNLRNASSKGSKHVHLKVRTGAGNAPRGWSLPFTKESAVTVHRRWHALHV